MERLGVIIRAKREERNLSQTELAFRINRSSQLICDIEKGRKNPGPETLVLLAKELDISLDHIFLEPDYASRVKTAE